MDTDTGRELGTSQSHSRHKKRHMTNIYLKDSDKETIVDFVKDHEELYDKTNKHFKDKLSVKVCKPWFNSQRTRYNNLRQEELDSG